MSLGYLILNEILYLFPAVAIGFCMGGSSTFYIILFTLLLEFVGHLTFIVFFMPKVKILPTQHRIERQLEEYDRFCESTLTNS